MEELVQDSAASQGRSSPAQSSLFSLYPGEPLWEHTELDLHLPVIPSPQVKLLLLQGSSEDGRIE